MPPVDRPHALRLIDGLRLRPLLDGFRGRPAVSIDALARAIVDLSALAEDLAGQIAALDINPLVVTETGCVAVDALLIPASPT